MLFEHMDRRNYIIGQSENQDKKAAKFHAQSCYNEYYHSYCKYYAYPQKYQLIPINLIGMIPLFNSQVKK